MRSKKAQEIVRSIVESTLGITLGVDASTEIHVNNSDWGYQLSRSIQKELDIEITPADVEACTSLSQLSAFVERRLLKDSDGRSLIDIYVTLEQIAREELNPDIHYHWHAQWGEFSQVGTWLTVPDGLDYVELVMRVEEEFGFGVPNQDAEKMRTVGETVRYLWNRSCTKGFTLRPRPEGVCLSAFIFYEIRRVLMARGGVPRRAVRLDAQLGKLLPSWYAQFWTEVQQIFQVDLTQGCLLALNLRRKKRTRIKELVSMITTSYSVQDAAHFRRRGARWGKQGDA